MEEELSKERRTLIKLDIDGPFGICDGTTYPTKALCYGEHTCTYVAKNCAFMHKERGHQIGH